ncbi:MAG TPA: hypothetical protein VLS89_17475 [Candidatus Nanopelagicales bacterium]|nr:hypothetical protein [Candidatus Nanopelagicales bacterium]
MAAQHEEPDARSAEGGEAAPEAASGVGAWLGGAPLPERWHLTLGLFAPAMVLIASMLRVRSFTIDDAFISYRYSRNLARGLGLVYNEGERIEGYTNFLWTVILAGGVRVGLDPDALAKVLGGAAACGTLWAAYVLERRLLPLRSVPPLGPWLLASSIAQAGYAMFGLETSFFVFLVLLGTELLFRETDRGGLREAFPWSGLVFGLAGLTRPEAPAFLGIPMLFLGLRFFSPQNLLRGVIFAGVVGLHMLWRHGYYGTWLPNTLSAKTGDLMGQIHGGTRYLAEYGRHAWPALLLSLFGLSLSMILRHRRALCLGAVGVFVLGYVLLVGGDWMPLYRFVAPFEPYAFALAGMGGRAVIEAVIRASAARPRAVLASVGLAAAFAGVVAVGAHRGSMLARGQRRILFDDKVFWDSAAGGVADWFAKNGERGEIGVADMGYIGYATDYPVLDLLGLVDPVISQLPGGYTQKTGPGFVQRVFEKMPRYFVFVGNREGCARLPFPSQEKLRRDRRFQRVYRLAGQVRHTKDGYWCILDRGAGPAPEQAAPSPPPRPADAPRGGPND